jgi:hypothetical protein
MPQVMIALSVKDYKTQSTVHRMAKRSLNPNSRRRIGWRGRSSIMREFILYGFEQAAKDPEAFLQTVRETKDPLLGKKGRKDAGAERREGLVAAWEGVFPGPDRAPKKQSVRA